ncbi:hypothetical protein MP638_001123 [Amoeboaphelidium occidentale]|nr:hypothetical protein MP638_001123 [Amoeboaphelidium occidentale]
MNENHLNTLDNSQFSITGENGKEESLLMMNTTDLLNQPTDDDDLLLLLLSKEQEHSMVSSDLHKLKEAFIRERTLPELLPFEFETVQNVSEQLQHQMNYIKECNRLNRNPNNLLELLELELLRTKFYLKSYLRQRLLKIEEYSDHLSFSGNYEKEDLMAMPELEYLLQFQDLKQRFLQKSSTMNLPTPLQSLSDGGDALMKKPDVAKHVFVRVKESIGDCLLNQGTIPATFIKNDYYIIKYEYVKQYIQEDRMQVI